MWVDLKDLYSCSQDAIIGAAATQLLRLCLTCAFFPRLSPLLDVRAAREQMHLGGVTYPTLPVQDAAPRPQSGYGQHSAACSPTGSYARPLPPQPHSAYFSGMTGPQHPFYNRVRQEEAFIIIPGVDYTFHLRKSCSSHVLVSTMLPWFKK